MREGDFATTRTALQFISKYQREDGKMPHEIAQGASFVPWFKDFPYGYASADATPLYIIAMNDYVTESGDVAFAKEKWDSVWKAYQFLRSTYDDQDFPKNFGVGHGWVEGGPLLPVKSEFYHSGLGAEALRALSNLARLTSQDAQGTELAQAFQKQARKLNSAFWLVDKQRLRMPSFSGTDGKPIDEPSVLAHRSAMWFGLPSKRKRQRKRHDHATCRRRSPDRLGHAHPLQSLFQIQRGWLSLRVRLAAVHRLGQRRRVSLYHRPEPAYAEPYEPMRCLHWTVRFAACDRSFVRRLLPAALYQFAASNLVRRHDRKPAAPRHVGFVDRRKSRHADLRSTLARGLEFARRQQPARRRK